ncbi:MAG: hypothetical protein H6757_03780 [Candidatus Omnitrophica bacterium]|nr:hypothetical protein [Candidatus Omnitrophota bacterium]
MQPPESSQLFSIELLRDNTRLPVTASRRSIYEKLPDGIWRERWQIQNPSASIRKLVSFSATPYSLFALTTDGAYMGDFKSGTWSKIFNGKTNTDKNVLSFGINPANPNHWFLGTASGLFESDNAGKTWFRFTRFIKNKPVSVIRLSRHEMFVAAGDRLFRSTDMSSFETVFSFYPSSSGFENTGDQNLITDENEETLPAGADIFIHELILRDNGCSRLWLATEKGVFESSDCAGTWQTLPSNGLREIAVHYLVFSEKAAALFAGTTNSIYRFSLTERRWQEVYQGLSHPRPYGLTITEADDPALLAVTDDGFVVRSLLAGELSGHPQWLPSPKRVDLFKALINLEPSVRQVQQRVIRYGNLTNAKINRWHAASRLSALLPDLSFGRDFSRSNNTDLDRGSTSTPDVYINGPDDVNHGWDFDVSWDLGDFIWSSSQTSIDNREKLMVDFRNDLLSEVTRIYFERRRLQTEMLFTEPSEEYTHYEKLIRLEELTALLDAMTNGFFSKHMEKVYLQHPELEQLWASQNVAKKR